MPAGQPRVSVATGRCLGEGFDDAQLDTLCLALPLSRRGTLTQYVGRLQRLNAAKQEVVIYDYLAASFEERLKLAAGAGPHAGNEELQSGSQVRDEEFGSHPVLGKGEWIESRLGVTWRHAQQGTAESAPAYESDRR